MVAQTRRGRPWWAGAYSLLFQVVGAGMFAHRLIGILARHPKRWRVRPNAETPIVARGQKWRDQAYVRVGDPRALGEARPRIERGAQWWDSLSTWACGWLLSTRLSSPQAF